MLSLYMSLISDENDRVKLENIYNTYHDLIFKIAYKITEHQYYAETAMSNTLFVLVNNIKKIRTKNERELKAFIITVTKNEAISVLKEKNKDNGIIQKEKSINLSHPRITENALIHEEDRIKVLNAINSMPLSYRQVLILRLVNNLSVFEISRILKRNRSTLRVQIKRGKDMLRKILTDAGFDDEN